MDNLKLLNGRSDAFGHMDSLINTGVGEDHSKLFATIPGH